MYVHQDHGFFFFLRIRIIPEIHNQHPQKSNVKNAYKIHNQLLRNHEYKYFGEKNHFRWSYMLGKRNQLTMMNKKISEIKIFK